MQVMHHESRADRAAGVAGRGLYPDILESPVAKQLAIRDTVERHAAGQAQVSIPVSRASERASRRTTSSVTT